MTIWIDADACPKVIKEILLRAADRKQCAVTLVANQALRFPPSPYVQQIIVPKGFDLADNEIIARCQAGDLVITSDIPLAAEVIKQQGCVLTPRGESLTADTIGERLVMRDFMETMRAGGIQSSGPSPLTPRERQQFAAGLEQWFRTYQTK